MRFVLFAAAAALLGFVVIAPRGDAAAAPEPIEVEAPRGPVVVELFTSQGCSSCPPADRLFAGLEGDVVALGFHVDYWNHLGWRDPFSDPRWSARQRRYGDVFERGYVYTPQLVVDGRAEAVGSDRAEVIAMLAEASARPPAATLELAVEAAPDGYAVAVEGRLGERAGEAVLIVAVTEGDFEIDVEAGENRRRTLHHRHVVRDLQEIGRVAPGAAIDRAVVIPLDRSWRREHLGVAAFLQDPVSLEIYGAALWRHE